MQTRTVVAPLLVVLLSIAVRSEPCPVTVSMVADRVHYGRGDTVIVAVTCAIRRGWHLYGNPLGPGIGKPVTLEVLGAEGISWTEARKTPARKYQPDDDEWVWVYRREALFFLVGTVRPDAPRRIEGRVRLEGLVCREACVPVEETIPFVLNVGPVERTAKPFETHRRLARRYDRAEKLAPEALAPPVSSDVSRQWEGSDPFAAKEAPVTSRDYEPIEKRRTMNLPVAVVLAFLAGLILNVMPCVLPVLGIKILAFAEGRARSRRETVLRSGAFAAGMMAVFVGLATLAAVAGFSWGQQFQTPAMLAGIVILIVIFALGMFDTYIIPVPSRLAALGEKGGKGYLGDGLKGMFTTILATPCSGPLLGATLAWTLRQPTMVIYAVFIAIGAGMALPYVLLASSSRLARLLPKPGPWMEDFRRVMGFLLLGFAVYLMTGLPRDMVVSTVGLCVAVAFALFLYGRVAPFGTGPGRKAAGAATALLIVAFGWYVMVDLWYGSISERARASTARTIRWEPFTPKRLTEAHMSGRHVVIDFTAAWCMNCQFNKVSVLHSDKVAGLIEEKEVLALKADITRHNAAAESLLHHLGSRSVPFFALFPGDDPYRPIVMRDILRKKRVVEALEGLAERP